jgi:hypothetical protein
MSPERREAARRPTRASPRGATARRACRGLRGEHHRSLEIIASQGVRDPEKSRQEFRSLRQDHPDRRGCWQKMGARGFEPRTSPLSGVRSSRLSYAPIARTMWPHFNRRARRVNHPLPQASTRGCPRGVSLLKSSGIGLSRVRVRGRASGPLARGGAPCAGPPRGCGRAARGGPGSPPDRRIQGSSA